MLLKAELGWRGNEYMQIFAVTYEQFISSKLTVNESHNGVFMHMPQTSTLYYNGKILLPKGLVVCWESCSVLLP